jgi:L-lysine 2,3-aminomutase
MKKSIRQNWENNRAIWLKNNLSADLIKLCQRNDIEIPKMVNPDSDGNRWGNWQWHIKNRVTTVSDLLKLHPEYVGQEKALARWLESYDLSILPLNQIQPNGINKFLPHPGVISEIDPYGVQQEHALILRERDNQKYYLSTRKPGYATFLPIIGGGANRVYCPIGCAGCYRGPQTRFNEPLRNIKEDGSIENIIIPNPVDQIRWLVEEWNSNQEFKNVYDILISGGEPMMLSNSVWKLMLMELEKATNLRSFRICTGALFLGLPFRFDEEFINLLTDFRNRTGIQVKLSVHISHPENITPEAIIYARRLVSAGIELLPQCPLEAGVNFWMNDLEKTEQTLRRLDLLLATVIGVRGYKWIIDMQRRRVNEGVSILSAIEVWRRLHDCHQGESDITRPTSLALFFPHELGNLNLSFHSLWAIKMEVAKDVVKYQIPHPAGGWLNYEEPLWKEVNDDEKILEKLRNS